MLKNAGMDTLKAANPLAAVPSSYVQKLTYEELFLEHGIKVAPTRVRKNKDILVMGKHYGTVFVNHDGWLLRYKILHNGDRQILDFILPGQIFGLQACIFDVSLYSVATITDTSLSAISSDMIDHVFEQSPRFAKALFWSALCDSAILGEHLIDSARRSAYERVSHLFLELFVRLSRAGLTKGMSFHMPLTQELIGDALGLTTVHVNRTFRSLREDKLISIDDKWVTILDFEALSLLCDFENSYLGETAKTLWAEVNAAAKLDQSSQRKKASRLES